MFAHGPYVSPVLKPRDVQHPTEMMLLELPQCRWSRTFYDIENRMDNPARL